MKKKSIGLFALMLLVGLTMYYVAGTYAKYTSSGTYTGSAVVARWDFSSSNFTVDIDLPATIDETTLVDDRIAPGTSGSFDIDLVNTNGEVGVDFVIDFSDTANVPSNLVFTTPVSGTPTALDPTSQTITGKVAPGESLTVTVNWSWPYETSGTRATEDGEDTTDGSVASVSDRTMTISATITGTQVQPGDTVNAADDVVTGVTAVTSGS